MENKLFLIKIINSYDLLAFKVSCLLFFCNQVAKNVLTVIKCTLIAGALHNFVMDFEYIWQM